MLREELLKKIRLIEIGTRKMMDDALAGNYRSHFKGHGMQFSEHRQYVPGDDVRHIDWKVSARSRDPLVKKYEEERELTVFLIVDVSASEGFGTRDKMKSEVAAEIAAMLAHASNRSGDKIGALLFGGEVELVIPPKKGRAHLLRIVREVLSFEPKSKGTNLDRALLTSYQVLKHAGIVFIISDFIAEGYDKSLKRMAKRHDVVAVQVSDEREETLPAIGSLYLCDPETGSESLVDTSSYRFKQWFADQKKTREDSLKTLFRSAGVEELKIKTQEDYIDAVVRFFYKRA